ncbi:MAG: AtpZ/AtpI family protein [Polaribacter sp.]
MKRKSNSLKKPLNHFAKFSGLAFQMLVIIGIGVFLGTKLDQIFSNNYKLFTIICSLAFIGIAMYSVIKKVTHFPNSKNT